MSITCQAPTDSNGSFVSDAACPGAENIEQRAAERGGGGESEQAGLKMESGQ